jgi:hypothetical protein
VWGGSTQVLEDLYVQRLRLDTHTTALKETGRMFWFGRKKSHEGRGAQPPDKLFFKSAEAAFEYTCKFMANSIETRTQYLV